ncbi:MAG: alcohol dehydrogenase catalytic domain-containing protein [Deltaproteobacteria bacterium]|nr:alcohol dehydrogenase catalytic domain-containing protein [Deltaproteobacteria bacterium]
MKAIVKTKQERGIEVLDVDMPEVGDVDILVKVRCGSLCGSDVHLYEYTPGYEWVPLPIIPGHEYSGEVVETGSKVRKVTVGDRITTLPYMSCSRCDFCQVGDGEACIGKMVLGLLSNGAFAEYLKITAAAHILKIPDNVSDEAASLCEPLSVAIHAVELSGILPGQTTAVLGPGPIGLLTLQVLKTSGASFVMMVGTGTDMKRLEVARLLGADAMLNVEEDDPAATAAELTGGGFGAGLDIVFEASGNPASIPQALNMVRPGGKVVLIGIHPDTAEFSPTDVVRGRKSLIGAYAYEPDTWKRALALLSSGQITVEPMITHKLPLTEGERGFKLAAAKEAAKVIFIP